MGKNCDTFNYDSCSFRIEKAKEATARVVLFREFSLPYSYTMECSLCGPSRGLYKDCHFTPSMLREIGEQFCHTIYDMSEKDQIKVKQAMKEIE